MKTNLFALLLVVLVAGCRKDPDVTTNPPPVAVTTRAVYVLNEGNFNDPAGARLTLYDYASNTASNDVYESANNGAHLGSVGDDMKIVGEKLYLLMSGSNQIRILSLPGHGELMVRTFPGGFDSTIHDLCVDTLHHKIFVTRLFSNMVSVLSLDSLKLLKNIPVGLNPQGLYQVGDNLFIANSGYGADSTVSVLNIPALAVVRTIVTAPGPSSICLTSLGTLAVACTGDSARGGAVAIIDPNGLAAPRLIHATGMLFGAITADNAGNVYANGTAPIGNFGGDIIKIALSNGTITSNFRPGTYYALAYNANTEELFASYVDNFQSNSTISIIGMDGAVRKTFPAGLGAGTFAFRWR